MAATTLEFLKRIRYSSFFHSKMISASNNNEDFEYLNPETGCTILVRNEGLSTNESSMIQSLKQKNNIAFAIDDKLIFELTNGNGYLISKIMKTKGEIFQEKIQKFTDETSDQMEQNILKFFQLKLEKLSKTTWKEKFPEILNYLDQEIIIPPDKKIHIDKNFTYVDEKGYLKSTCSLAKKNFVNCYLEKSNSYDEDNFISGKMWDGLKKQ